jgi:hypothetical protein
LLQISQVYVFKVLVDFGRSSEEDIPLWSGVDRDNVGTFDSNGVFRLGEASSSLLEGALEPEDEKLPDELNFKVKEDGYLFSSSNTNEANRDHRRAMSHPSGFFFKSDNTDTLQWTYRDPAGIIRGPFSALEMQGWFDAGYFDITMAVKREDASFFEPIAELMHRVKDPKTPFLAVWPEFNNKSSFPIDPFGPEGSTTPGGSSLFGNMSFMDRISHQQDNPLLFNNPMDANSSMGNMQPPFSASNLPRVNPIAHDHRTPLSPWERPLSNNNSGLSWLNTDQASFRQQEVGYDYQQQQQMEQQYLHMLRQNQQHHLQLQQQMLLQQQQLMMQQQQQQQQDMFIRTQQANVMSRGWSSVPGTPGLIEPNIQSLWSNHTNQDSPFGSRSPPEDTMFKTQIEDNKLDSTSVSDQLTEKLSTMHIGDSPLKQDLPKTSQGKTFLIVDKVREAQLLLSIDTVSAKKTLREIQSEQAAAQKNLGANPTRSNTWSSVSAGKPASISPSYSANTNRVTRQSSSAWDKPTGVRQKRVSMTAATPSASMSAPKSSISERSTIKSEPKGPSEDFIKWCKLSLRGLNPGVNGMCTSLVSWLVEIRINVFFFFFFLKKKKADDILQMLLDFPADDSCAEIIQDMIYANSTSMDGRRFANDFMTRRKADMDGKKLNLVLPKATAIMSSEFKVVTKKGKKKPSSTK